MVRHKILIFALTAALVTDIGLLVVLCPDGLAADFAAYWRAANSVHPYDFSITPFANPPTTLLWLQPLRFLPEWPAYLLLSLVSVLAFAAFGSRLYGLRATLLGFLSPPFVLGFVPGQLAILEASLVFLAFSSPPVVCAVLLAIAGSVKPQIVFLAPIALYVANGPKAVFAFLAAAATLVGAATLAFGTGIWADWFFGMQSLVNEAARRNALLLAVSPLGFFGSFGTLRLLGVLALAALGGAAFYRFRDRPAPERAAVLVACSLFAAPYALSYDMVAMGPFAAAVILRDKTWRGLCAAFSYCGAFGPISLLAALLALNKRAPLAVDPIERDLREP